MQKVNRVIPGPDDVLHGRGFVIQSHSGNRRLHAIVDELKFQYQRSRREGKRNITRQILSIIKNENGGRFLKCSKPKEWIEVDDDEALLKIGHTIRSRLDQQYFDKLETSPKELDKDTQGPQAASNPAPVLPPGIQSDAPSGSPTTDISNTSPGSATKDPNEEAANAPVNLAQGTRYPPLNNLQHLMQMLPHRTLLPNASATLAREGSTHASASFTPAYAAIGQGFHQNNLSGVGNPFSISPVGVHLASSLPLLEVVAAEERVLLARLAELQKIRAIHRLHL